MTSIIETTQTVTGERADLLESIGQHRFFLRFTARDLTDAQARLRSTASELTVGGLIKHVTATEAAWVRFVEGGPDAMMQGDPDNWAADFIMTEDETLDGILGRYAEVAEHTDELLSALPDLDAAQPLPEAPWFEAGARWSARRVFLHIIAETAQHAGHTDIVRESLDGSKTMG
ncbi:MAG: DinB family protein [Actinomycetota bacterium]|nr:DinB family protein [Actinomycetota bacterium]